MSGSSDSEDGLGTAAGDRDELEPVLAVPPPLTRVAYAALARNDLVPRKWHVEGRYGTARGLIESSR